MGASVRAVGQAAIRAGWSPVGLDRYADRDLAAIAWSRAVDAEVFPDALADLAATAPPGPWLYTGPLENHPDLIDRIARTRPLWGNRGESLRGVREPFAVVEVLDRAGLPRVEVRTSPDGLSRDGSWLVKPVASGGGLGIAEWSGVETAGPVGPVVYQRKIVGTSAAMVAVCGGGRASVVGLTAQRLGLPGVPFGYAGSLGPIAVAWETRRLLERLADVLASRFGLVGLIGVDLVIDAEGVPWPIEVNPRIPASAEILELALGRSLLVDHRTACERGLVPEPGWGASSSRSSRLVGKAILTATAAGTVPDLRGWIVPRRGEFRRPGLADVPAPGAPFQAGDPVLTVLASGSSRPEVERRLERKLASLRRVLAQDEVDSPSSGVTCHVSRI